ncbi:MAG: VOC family protein [Anaerolineae bacterium]|nr:VOC family protein [Anaerolineae bacterium]
MTSPAPNTPPAPIHLTVDHVTIAGSTLAALENAFADIGLTTDYGGPHSNGITHMSLLGFDDGSYIELISSMQPGQKDQAFWGEHIVGDGGPCAWAVYMDDVAAEAERMRALGVTVKGPNYYHRRRPDGQLVEWNLAFLGDKGAGATLPFIIKDITPRSLRVQPSASVTNSLLTGIAQVIIGVRSLPETSQEFERFYLWERSQNTKDRQFEANLVHFPKTPVTLAAPLAEDDWLAERLARFDESPCAYLIGTTDMEAAGQQFDLLPPVAWFGQRVAWFDRDRLNGVRLGLIG